MQASRDVTAADHAQNQRSGQRSAALGLFMTAANPNCALMPGQEVTDQM
jgi:hypothetical protein